MICPYCETNIPDGSEICPCCGSSLRDLGEKERAGGEAAPEGVRRFGVIGGKAAGGSDSARAGGAYAFSREEIIASEPIRGGASSGRASSGRASSGGASYRAAGGGSGSGASSGGGSGSGASRPGQSDAWLRPDPSADLGDDSAARPAASASARSGASRAAAASRSGPAYTAPRAESAYASAPSRPAGSGRSEATGASSGSAGFAARAAAPAARVPTEDRSAAPGGYAASSAAPAKAKSGWFRKLLVILLCFGLGYGAYQLFFAEETYLDVAKKYAQASAVFDLDEMNKYLAYDLKEQAALSGQTWTQAKAAAEQAKARLKSVYGSDYKIKVDCKLEREYESLASIRILLSTHKDYGIDEQYVTGAAQVSVTAKISGSKNSASSSVVLTLIKYRGKWKVFTEK